MQETKLNIFQKMSLATEKIQKVKKGLTVEVSSKSKYKAVSETDILNAVKPIEIECGIYSYPFSRQIIKDERVVYKSQYGDRETFIMRIETVYRFVNVDKPEEFIDITTYGDGVDTQDKAPGKAMTYADKYALLKAYKIETGDDPDKEASQELSKHESELKNIYIAKLSTEVAKTDTDYEELLKYFNVKSNTEMTIDQLKQALAILSKKVKKGDVVQ